jgi:hypothetical protein
MREKMKLQNSQWRHLPPSKAFLSGKNISRGSPCREVWGVLIVGVESLGIFILKGEIMKTKEALLKL